MSNRRKSKYERRAQFQENRVKAHAGHAHSGGMAPPIHPDAYDTSTRGMNSPEQGEVITIERTDGGELVGIVDEAAEFPSADIAGVPEHVERYLADIVTPDTKGKPTLNDWAATNVQVRVALADETMGHKAVADLFEFTTESSVRRYRKAHDIEVQR